MIQRIVSGAQTGADRAALDAALSLGYDCGGWVPRGRLDEKGRIPDRYPNLKEAADDKPETRTALNVRDSDATIIFSHGSLSGGSEYTQAKADELDKPNCHSDLSSTTLSEAVLIGSAWLRRVEPRVLNVAGPRASDDAEIYAKTRRVLEQLLMRDGSEPSP